MLDFLNINQAQEVFDAFIEYFDPATTAWVNAPEVSGQRLTHTSGWGDSAVTREISPAEALEIYKRKVDGAYTERCSLFLAQLPAIVANGYDVALVQFANDDSAPFDAKGWIVVVVGSMPIYHLAPWDLNMSQVASFVNILANDADPAVSWKGTNKKGEIAAINAALTQKGADLLAIAKKFSA